MAEHLRLDRRQFIRPHLIVKRWGPFLLFAVLAIALSAATDPKLFEGVDRASRDAPIAVLFAVALGTHLIVLAIVWFVLEKRYIAAVQTVVATVTFLVVLTAASLIGFWCRMTFLGDSEGNVRAFGPTAYTLRDGLAAAIALTLTGSGFTVAHNFAFQRKANYASFHKAQSKLLAHVAAMRAVFDRNEALDATEVVTLRKLCKSAVDALPSALAEEEHTYGTFVDAAIGTPLAEIRRLADSADVAANPADFLRACGLARPSEPWDSSFVAKMTAAYQQLEGTR